MKELAVIGLGRFGTRLAADLYRAGADVIAVDSDADKVEDAKGLVTTAMQMDATDEEALETLCVSELDACVVAIGKDIEASILVTALLKQQGAPIIITRASTALQARILRLVGADRVIYPEEEVASRLARSLASPHILNSHLLEGTLELAEIVAPSGFAGKSLRELELRQRYGINVVAIHRHGRIGDAQAADFVVPTADDVIRDTDVLIMIGSEDDIAAIDRLS